MSSSIHFNTSPHLESTITDNLGLDIEVKYRIAIGRDNFKIMRTFLRKANLKLAWSN